MEKEIKDTWVIAYSSEDSCFCMTRERGHFWQFGKEFRSRGAAERFFTTHQKLFLEKEKEIMKKLGCLDAYEKQVALEERFKVRENNLRIAEKRKWAIIFLILELILLILGLQLMFKDGVRPDHINLITIIFASFGAGMYYRTIKDSAPKSRHLIRVIRVPENLINYDTMQDEQKEVIKRLLKFIGTDTTEETIEKLVKDNTITTHEGSDRNSYLWYRNRNGTKDVATTDGTDFITDTDRLTELFGEDW